MRSKKSTLFVTYDLIAFKQGHISTPFEIFAKDLIWQWGCICKGISCAKQGVVCYKYLLNVGIKIHRKYSFWRNLFWEKRDSWIFLLNKLLSTSFVSGRHCVGDHWKLSNTHLQNYQLQISPANFSNKKSKYFSNFNTLKHYIFKIFNLLHIIS